MDTDDSSKSESLETLFKTAVERIDVWCPDDEHDSTTVEFKDENGYDVYIDVSVKNFSKQSEYFDGRRRYCIDYNTSINSTSVGYFEEDKEMSEQLFEKLIKHYE